MVTQAQLLKQRQLTTLQANTPANSVFNGVNNVGVSVLPANGVVSNAVGGYLSGPQLAQIRAGKALYNYVPAQRIRQSGHNVVIPAHYAEVPVSQVARANPNATLDQVNGTIAARMKGVQGNFNAVALLSSLAVLGPIAAGLAGGGAAGGSGAAAGGGGWSTVGTTIGTGFAPAEVGTTAGTTGGMMGNMAIGDWAQLAGMVMSATGTGGKGSAPSASTTTTPAYTPQQLTQLNKIFSNANLTLAQQQQLLQATGLGAATVANAVPMSGLTQSGMASILGYSANELPAQFRDARAAEQYGLTGAMDVQNNPYLRSAMDAATRPLIDNFTNAGGVLSNLRNGAVEAGGYGGSRQGIAEGLAARSLAQKVGDVQAAMASDAYNKGQDTFAKTLSLSPSIAQLGLMPGQQQVAAGGAQEGYQQAANNANAAKIAAQFSLPWDTQNSFANIIYGGTRPGSTVATNSTNGTASTAQQVMAFGQLLNQGNQQQQTTGANGNIWGMTR